MRILVVEDEVRLASTLKDLLEMNGYAADVCHDGESGLDNALSGIYDSFQKVLFPAGHLQRSFIEALIDSL